MKKWMPAAVVALTTTLAIAASSAQAKSPEVGQPAPEFKAKNQDGAEKKLSDSQGKWVLLYFYPKDETPGCTKEACRIRDDYKQFTTAGVVVYGVSRQSADSHRKFRDKHHLPFDLLVDEKGEIGDAYGIGSMPIIGGILGLYKRQSVLIDPTGKIARFMDSVDPETHATEVLETVKKAGPIAASAPAVVTPAAGK